MQALMGSFHKDVGRQFNQFEIFDGKELNGVAFRQICSDASEIFRVVGNELDSGRCVAISVRDPGSGLSHIWIIYAKTNGDYLNFSKSYGDVRIISLQNLEELVRSKGEQTDILIYSVEESKSPSTHPPA